MAESLTSNNSGKKSMSYSRRQNKPIKVDLTPMVDLGFILITFFVFTTTLSESKVTDLIYPKGEVDTRVPESGAMTVIVGENNDIFYYFGQLEKDGSNLYKESQVENLRSLIVTKKHQTELSKLMFIIKSDINSTFGNLIKVHNEMAICAIPNGHFAEVDISDLEVEVIRAYQNRDS